MMLRNVAAKARNSRHEWFSDMREVRGIRHAENPEMHSGAYRDRR